MTALLPAVPVRGLLRMTGGAGPGTRGARMGYRYQSPARHHSDHDAARGVLERLGERRDAVQ